MWDRELDLADGVIRSRVVLELCPCGGLREERRVCRTLEVAGYFRRGNLGGCTCRSRIALRVIDLDILHLFTGIEQTASERS